MDSGILQSEFVFESGPFASCHAATLAEVNGEILCAFFGGTREGNADVCIWASRLWRGTWTPPVKVGEGILADGSRCACWNPVLFVVGDGELVLFYKVGPSPSKWWGMIRRSEDGGRSWTEAARLPEGILGPAKNKPVRLAGGEILSPCSVEDSQGWRIYFERSADEGRTWTKTSLVEQGAIVKATQPTILIHSQRRLQAIGRTTVGKMFETWSEDAGATWGRLELIGLPNCNSGIDAVTLADGRHLVVYNHSNLEKVRYPLNVAVSRDGKLWEAGLVLESEPPGQYSYPAVIQSSDGMVHVAYTFKRRRIKHVVVDPGKIRLSGIEGFVCPPVGSLTHRVDEFQ